ncbi:MAG: class I SAM-dependent methyltransferase, partial [Pseudomonadota bacterium]
ADPRYGMEHDLEGTDNRGFWERTASDYDRKTAFLRRSYGLVVAKIVEDVRGSGRVLEVAAGTGTIALEMAGTVTRVDAVDFAANMIKTAREKARARGIDNVSFSEGTAYRLDFAESTFDAVVMCNALHVMEHPEIALAEAKRVLVPGGRLIVPTYCHGQTLISRILSRLMGLTGFIAYHRFTPDTLSALVRAGGFEIDKTESVSDWMPAVYLTARKPVLSAI